MYIYLDEYVYRHPFLTLTLSLSVSLCLSFYVRLSLSLSLSVSVVVSGSPPSALPILGSSEVQAPAPQTKSMEDIEELAASYERKLIEVSDDCCRGAAFAFPPDELTIFSVVLCDRDSTCSAVKMKTFLLQIICRSFIGM